MEKYLLYFYVITMFMSIIGSCYLILVTREKTKKLDIFIIACLGVSYNIIWGFCYNYFFGKIIIGIIILSWIIVWMYFSISKLNVFSENIKQFKEAYLFQHKKYILENKDEILQDKAKIKMYKNICIIYGAKNSLKLKDATSGKEKSFAVEKIFYIGLLISVIISNIHSIFNIMHHYWGV